MEYSHIKTQIISKLSIIIIGMLGILYVTSCNKIAQTVPLPNAQPDFYFEDMDYIAPCEVLFENRTYYAQEFEWDFGDGRTYIETDKLYYFEDAGTYNVTLKAINPDGKAQSITKSITILSNDAVPAKHPYDGKWQVMSVLSDTKKKGLPDNTIVGNSIMAGPDLGPFTPDGWQGPVVVRNSLFNPDNIQPSEISYGDGVFAAFGFQNLGDEDIFLPTRILVTVDGNYVTQWDHPSPFSAGAAQYYYDIYLGALSPGMHTVTFTLDATNYVAEADESNNVISHQFEVKDVIAFTGFEFNKNRYVMYFSDGIRDYGLWNIMEMRYLWRIMGQV
jgi:PKD repeat protein